MTDERIEFDIGKARTSMARFRADLESIDRIYKKLQDAVDDSGSWWKGKSHDAFMRLAGAILEKKAAFKNVVHGLAENMDTAIREKLKNEEEDKAFISRQADELTSVQRFGIEPGVKRPTHVPDGSAGRAAKETPGATAGLNPELPSFAANARVERNNAQISYSEMMGGALGFWRDPWSGKWFERIRIYDPAPIIFTMEVAPPTALEARQPHTPGNSGVGTFAITSPDATDTTVSMDPAEAEAAVREAMVGYYSEIFASTNAKAYEKDSFGVKKLTEDEIRSIAANYINVVMAFYCAPKNEDGFVSIYELDIDMIKSLCSLNLAPYDTSGKDPYETLMEKIIMAKTELLASKDISEHTREALQRNFYPDGMISQEIIDYIAVGAVVSNSTIKNIVLVASITAALFAGCFASVWGPAAAGFLETAWLSASSAAQDLLDKLLTAPELTFA